MRSDRPIVALEAGFGGVEAWKQEVTQNEARRGELQAIVAAAEAEPSLPALHPRMADVFRQKTVQFAAALEHSDDAQREAARSTPRGFIDRIVILPGEGLLQVVGNLGETLTAAGGRSGSATVVSFLRDRYRIWWLRGLATTEFGVSWTAA
jgi:hypothetical protein